MTDRLPHTLRSDARDNRERLLDAARAVFAADGLNVPMREIARRARVGPATLYRRFPTKEILVTEAFKDQMRACQAIADEGLADPDPWHGFCLVIERICELHARDRGFTAAFMSTFPHAMDFAAIRAYSLNAVAALARRAKDAGRLRPDFVLDDLILMLMANSGIHASSPAARVAASRRFAALVIEAFQALPARLVGELAAQSPRFSELWESGDLNPPHATSKRKIIDYPAVGRITLDCDVLLVATDDVRIMMYTAEPGTEDAERLELAIVLGTQTLVE